MPVMDLEYKIKTATEENICLHLQECNSNFVPPLSERLDIDEYSKKIFDKSITFEAWENDVLAGLIATYFDYNNLSAFVTNVSVMKGFMGLGLASELLNMCIDYASKQNILEIKLEVNNKNDQAINLYKKFNFIPDEFKTDILIMKFYIPSSKKS
jgi:ribosomal protein S18 acetylase RimI-like enzyme